MQTGALYEGAGLSPLATCAPRLRGRAENCHSAAVLRPARDVVADRDRTLLAIRHGAHAVGLDAARGEIIANRLGPAGAERDVVFARAAFVGVAFDREGVIGVLLQPLRLLVERAARLHRELSRIRLEEDAVADIDDEVLLAARRGGAGRSQRVVGLLVGAGRQGEPRDQRGDDACTTEFTQHTGHAGSPSSSFRRTCPGLAGGSLSERSINLDEALSRPGKMHRPPERNVMVNEV